MGWQTKAKGKAGAKAKAKGKTKSAKAVKQSADKEEQLQAKAKSKALQAISESIHLRHFGSVSLNSTKVEGKTLVELVTDDKYAVMTGARIVKFGSTYFRTLAQIQG